MNAMVEPGKVVEEPETVEEDPSQVVAIHPRADRAYQRRVVEALLFAASEPLSEAQLAECLAEGAEVPVLLEELEAEYKGRGVNLQKISGKWTFRTAEDLSFLLRREAVEQKRLSRAALETLAIIAYHQPVTRAEIEEVRGVSVSKGTIDALMEMGWVRMRGRRRVPGRPVTYGTTEDFMSHFGLTDIKDLPGVRELKGAGLLDANVPADFEIPVPMSGDEVPDDEDDLEDENDEPTLDMYLPPEIGNGPH